ncbi:MAG: hypothetical protein LBT75_01470 [Bacilli bacterium]|nr:hypothetical protein [Bacilli bacterium]
MKIYRKIILNKYFKIFVIASICVNIFIIDGSKHSGLTYFNIFTIISTILATFIGLIISDLSYYERNIYQVNNKLSYLILSILLLFILIFIYIFTYCFLLNGMISEDLLIYIMLSFLEIIILNLIVMFITLLKLSYNTHIILTFSLCSVFMFFDIFFLQVDLLSYMPITIYEYAMTRLANSEFDYYLVIIFILEIFIIIIINSIIIKLQKRGLL